MIPELGHFALALAVVIAGAQAALPLLGCAGGYTAPQAEAVPPTPAAASAGYYVAPPQVYMAGPTAPAAIVVFLPGAGPAASAASTIMSRWPLSISPSIPRIAMDCGS